MKNGVLHIQDLILQGESSAFIYEECVRTIKENTGRDSGIFLPDDRNHDTFILTARSEKFSGTSPSRQFDIYSTGASIGSLVVETTESLTDEEIGIYTSLVVFISLSYEREKNALQTQLLHDRLQVLNELNQLIASNVSIERIFKTLARESAFRFSADAAISLLLSEDGSSLQILGSYGCNPTCTPTHLPPDSGVVGQVLRIGGHLSVTDLSTYPQHGLGFLIDSGMRGIDICALEVKGEALGLIILGCRREQTIGPGDLTRFEEFCRGAAVAIANARTQQRIQSYTERLEELVTQRTQDLAVQTARAEDANQAKSKFLANMSHELRTPLTSIVGYSSILTEGIFGPLNASQLDALNAICKSSEHLKNLIDDVLNLARVESGKENPEPKRLPLEETITAPYKLILQTAVQKNISLADLNIPQELKDLGIYADPKHTQQIFLNLLSNAIKYTPSGGKVWIDVSQVVDKIKVQIHDNGVGISKAKQAVLFERFERGEDSYSKNQEGTGIGLNLTKHLVEINGGRIGVESEEGKGSTFWFMLPVCGEDTLSVVSEDTNKAKVRLDGLTALVVDDNVATVDVLKNILAAAGASVTTASSVKEGLVALNSQTPDIVLTDLAMPEESGLSFIEKIRNNLFLEVPIIVLSACAFQSDEDEALKAGASIFMAKPFRPQDVVKTVRSLTLNVALQS